MTCSTSEQLHPPQGNRQQHPLKEHFFSKASVKSSYAWYIVSNQAAYEVINLSHQGCWNSSQSTIISTEQGWKVMRKGQTNQILDLILDSMLRRWSCCFKNSVWVPCLMFLGEFLKLLLFDSAFRNVICKMWHSIPDRPLFVIASPLLCIVMQWCDTLLHLNTSWQNSYL